MNIRQQRRLQAQLRSVGATGQEASRLANVAHRLGRLESNRNNRNFQRRDGPSHRRILYGLSGLAIVMTALMVFSQTALPGGLLYPLQKLSDDVVVSIRPDYRGALMMKRADQVKQLVRDHAAPEAVLATLADYERQAAAYRSTASHYAAFSYCKQRLRAAAAQAPASERQAIQSTLASLNDS